MILDNLSQNEAQAAIKAIEETKQANLVIEQENYAKWFDIAILPILQDFSEMTSSVLEVEKPGKTHIVITIKNEQGLDITENCKMMKYALAFANHIGIDSNGGMMILILIFDYW
ncbi:hypothetical protein DS742_11915 [Lacrimispora amygdalina]|uniref:Uncharacterized protein n=1 Tax=Lacrimispora amygdalina TaxID=253257 RepID=A0A3E2NCQ8_9FIRM|nr:hypothetical protein [Clostridium indicum]RFZ78807.1 hypothetical protein DS742_11915 [Clostridium indicum]